MRRYPSLFMPCFNRIALFAVARTNAKPWSSSSEQEWSQLGCSCCLFQVVLVLGFVTWQVTHGTHIHSTCVAGLARNWWSSSWEDRLDYFDSNYFIASARRAFRFCTPSEYDTVYVTGAGNRFSLQYNAPSFVINTFPLALSKRGFNIG